LSIFLSASAIEAAAIERFRLVLIESNQQRLLKWVFQNDERWIMSPQTPGVIRSEKLSDALLAMFSQCEVAKQKAPSLVVREK
jgi:hypothetical protein